MQTRTPRTSKGSMFARRVYLASPRQFSGRPESARHRSKPEEGFAARWGEELELRIAGAVKAQLAGVAASQVGGAWSLTPVSGSILVGGRVIIRPWPQEKPRETRRGRASQPWKAKK